MSFLFDVTKRQPLHEAVRRHSAAGMGTLHRLRNDLAEYDPALRERKMHGRTDENGVRGGQPDVLHEVYRMSSERQRLQDEEAMDMDPVSSSQGGPVAENERRSADIVEDSEEEEEDKAVDPNDVTAASGLENLTEEEMALLTAEFYPPTYFATNEQHRLMDEILRVRQRQSPKLSYSHIPEAERNVWSAWYLRHLAK